MPLRFAPIKPTAAESVLIAACLALFGCTVGPDYHGVEPPAPVQWQAESGATLAAVDAESLKNWWHAFNDAKLDDLMQRALSGNLQLQIAASRIDQARAERRGIRAELFPSISAAANAQRNQNPFPALMPGLRYNQYEFGFDALWEIDLFGRQQRRAQAASAELDAAGAAYQQAQVSLTAELARAYIEYRSLQNQLRITGANLESQQRTLELTEKQFAEGVRAHHDVVRARAQSEATAAQLPALQAQLTATLRQLEILLGQQPGALTAELAAAADLPQAPARQLLLSPANTLRRRPDLRIAERRLAAATAMQGSATAELFPKISLSAFVGLRNNDIETLFKSAAFSYGTAANLLQPLLNFGRIRAGIDLADAKQHEAYLNYEQTVLQALQETETALTRYLQEEIRRKTLADTVADLRESVRLSQLRYREGVISFLDVLDAQRTLYSAEIELARSQAAAAINLIAVYKALGGGAETAEPPQGSKEN